MHCNTLTFDVAIHSPTTTLVNRCHSDNVLSKGYTIRCRRKRSSCQCTSVAYPHGSTQSAVRADYIMHCAKSITQQGDRSQDLATSRLGRGRMPL